MKKAQIHPRADLCFFNTVDMAGTDMGMDTDTGSYNMDMVDNLEQEHFQAPLLKSRL